MTNDYDFSKDVPPTDAERKAWRDGDKNVFDPDAAEGSIWQNRPAYLFQQEAETGQTRIEQKPLPIIEKGRKKDWNAKPANPPPPKDWSKLGR